jgi:hypothetical protein
MKLLSLIYLHRDLKVIFLFILFFVLLTDTIFSQLLHWKLLTSNDFDQVESASNGDLYAISKDNQKAYKSTNYGTSWFDICSPGTGLTSLKVKNDTIFAGGENGRLYVSLDAGNTFNLLKTFASTVYCSEYAKIDSFNLLLVGTSSNGVYISTNWGQTWNQKEFSGSSIWSLKIFDGKIFVGTFSNSLFISDDVGQTWNHKIIATANENIWSMEGVDSDGSIYISNGKVYKSIDSGDTWALVLNSSAYSIKYSSLENQIFAGEYMSSNNGTNWQLVFPSSTDCIAIADSTTFILGFDHKLYKEEHNPYTGHNYYPLSIGNKWQYIRYTYYDDGMSSTTNYSTLIREVSGDTIINGHQYFVIGTLYLHYGNDNRLYQWQNPNENLIMDFNLIWGETFQYGNSTAYIREGYNNSFSKQRYYKGFIRPYGTQGSESVSYVDSIGFNSTHTSDYFYVYSQSSEISLINAQVLYDDSLYYYSNHYKPQIIITPVISTDTINITLNFNVNHTYSKFSSTGTSRNFIKDVWLEYYYSKDDSSTIKDSLICQISENSTECSVTILLDSLKVKDGFKYNYAIYTRDKALIPEVSKSPETGYYQMIYQPEPSGIDDKKGNSYSFTLFQNYPNPFNPTTNIQYQIPNTEFVTIKVYDVLGNEIVTLIDKEQQAGNFTINFDGSHLASGIYFYQLKAELNIISKKMILLR